MYVLISDIVVSLCSNACCLIITLGVQHDMVDFVQGSIAQSIGMSKTAECPQWDSWFPDSRLMHHIVSIQTTNIFGF